MSRYLAGRPRGITPATGWCWLVRLDEATPHKIFSLTKPLKPAPDRSLGPKQGLEQSAKLEGIFAGLSTCTFLLMVTREGKGTQ